MKITLLEPYYTGSHKLWAGLLCHNSKHEIEIITLPGYFWKWRMHGGAISLFDSFISKPLPDLIVATDMLDLSTFRSLMNLHGIECPCILYFHENQLTYPWSPFDKDPGAGRDMHYGFINYSSALCADHVVFNSKYHQRSFLTALHSYLKKLPDHQGTNHVQEIVNKSSVLSPGIDDALWSWQQPEKDDSRIPLIVWNHRWEYDKNPGLFFKTLQKLKERGVLFRLCVLGEHFDGSPDEFSEYRTVLSDHIVQWGFAESRDEYLNWLVESDIAPVTSNQDFFGISALEATVCGAYPLLPNRLAFPEHLSDEQYYYETEDELLNKLITVIEKKLYCAEIRPRLEELRKYGWDEIASSYDQLFSEVGIKR